MDSGVLTRVACCKLPPVEADYTPKGTYETINGFKTYVTGPEDSDKAILSIYDIFGYSPQILQGMSPSHLSLMRPSLYLHEVA